MKLKTYFFCFYILLLNIIGLNISADSNLNKVKSTKTIKQTIVGTISETASGYSLRTYDEVKKEFKEYLISTSVGDNEQISLKKFIGKKVTLVVSVLTVKETKRKELVIYVKIKNPVITKIYSVE